MKCTRIDDWYEAHGDDSNGGGLADHIAHARSCPECASSMANRAVMLEAMREMPEPEPPRDLAARICQYLDIEAEETDDPDSAPNIVDGYIERWLKPVQYALAAAFVVTLVWAGIADRPRLGPGERHGGQTLAAAGRRAPAGDVSVPGHVEAGGKPSAPPQALAKLSEEDVAAFMRKMNEYRRSHPEMDDPRSGAPAGMLAADR